MRTDRHGLWFSVAAAVLATGCALETPDLALDREEAVTAFCGAMEVATVEVLEVVDLGAESEGLPCRLTPGPTTRICEMYSAYGEVRFVRGTRRPTFIIRGNDSDPPFLALAEVRGEPASGTVERRTAFEAEPATFDVVNPKLIQGPVSLPGHGLIGVDKAWAYPDLGASGFYDVFVWPTVEALPRREAQARPTAPPRSNSQSPKLLSTGKAVCAAVLTDAGHRFQRLYPDPGRTLPTPAVPGTFVEGPRPAVIATRFDGLLEIREPTPDCTALRPPVVRVPPATLRDPLWDGERLYVTANDDSAGFGFAVAGPDETRTFVPAGDSATDFPVLGLLENGAQAPGRPDLAVATRLLAGAARVDLYDGQHVHLGAVEFSPAALLETLDVRLGDGRVDVLLGSESGFLHVPFAIDCRAS